MQVNLEQHAIAAVLLAAGTSSRMAGPHKLTLALGDGRTVLEHAVERALKLRSAQILVVLQPGMPALQEPLSSLSVDVVLNPDYAKGMSTSLRTGISALRPGVQAALILLADQPAVEPSIITALVEAFESQGKAIAIPVYGEVPGPPTLFRRDVFPELLELTGDEGGRRVVGRDPARVARVHLPAEAMPADIDTPEDYERYLGGR